MYIWWCGCEKSEERRKEERMEGWMEGSFGGGKVVIVVVVCVCVVIGGEGIFSRLDGFSFCVVVSLA